MKCHIYNKEPVGLAANMDSYFKQKPPDCSLFSQDSFEFQVHKELLFQTEYLREMIKSVNKDTCIETWTECCKVEIFCPSLLKEDLEMIIKFLYSGKIYCDDQIVVTKVCKNLTQLFGFPSIMKLSTDRNFLRKTRKQKLTSTTDTFNLDDLLPSNKSNTDEQKVLPPSHSDEDLDTRYDAMEVGIKDKNFEETIEEVNETSNENIVEEGFVCLLCDSNYPIEMDLIKHVASDHGIKIQCTICDKLFKSSQELKEHKAYVHDKKTLYGCSVCQLEFLNENELKEHNSSVHEEKEAELQCSLCEKTFTEKITLKRHKMQVHKFKKYKCELCDKSFKMQKIFKRHVEKLCPMKNNPNGPKENPHICSYCGKNYNSQSGLFHHVTTIHEGRMFECSLCNTAFNSRDKLKKHLAFKHDGEVFDCNICQAKFASKTELSKHISIVHERKEACICSLCGKNLANKQSLRLHVLSVHEGIKYTCPICEIAYAQPHNLKKHMSDVHENTHQCAQCGEMFKTNERLKGHIAKSHDKTKLFECSICKAGYRTKKYLEEHIAYEHEKVTPHRCDLCENTFRNATLLKRHILSIHEGLTHECQLCSKVYKTAANLKHHIEFVHEGKEKPTVDCSLCGKTVATTSVLKRHIEAVHEKKRPYECQICSERFGQKAHLVTHLKGKHKSDPIPANLMDRQNVPLNI